MKKTWAIASETLSKNGRNSIPDNMVINSVDCSDKEMIADNFNKCFSLIGKLNANNIKLHR